MRDELQPALPLKDRAVDIAVGEIEPQRGKVTQLEAAVAPGPDLDRDHIISDNQLEWP